MNDKSQIRELLIRDDKETTNLSLRLPQRLNQTFRSYSENAGQTISDTARKALYLLLFPELFQEATSRLNKTGYPIKKSGIEREVWLNEHMAIVQEARLINLYLSECIRQNEALAESYHSNLLQSQGEGHKKYEEALHIRDMVAKGNIDRQEADSKITELLDMTYDEYEAWYEVHPHTGAEEANKQE